MIRLLELSCLSVFAGVNLLAQADVPPIVQKVGLLGLIAFMVVQNYRQSHENTKELNARNRRLEKLVADDIDAKRRLAEALHNLPPLSAERQPTSSEKPQ